MISDATINGILMALTGFGGTVIGVIIGYLKDRDKLKYDSRITLLETELVVTKANATKCTADHAETKKDLEEARKQIDKLMLIVTGTTRREG